MSDKPPILEYSSPRTGRRPQHGVTPATVLGWAMGAILNWMFFPVFEPLLERRDLEGLFVGVCDVAVVVGLGFVTGALGRMFRRIREEGL